MLSEKKKSVWSKKQHAYEKINQREKKEKVCLPNMRRY